MKPAAENAAADQSHRCQDLVIGAVGIPVATERLVADLILDRQPTIAVEAFSPDRS